MMYKHLPLISACFHLPAFPQSSGVNKIIYMIHIKHIISTYHNITWFMVHSS